MGLLLGGISVVDHHDAQASVKERRLSLWFLGQALVGPTIPVDLYLQHLKHKSVAEFGDLPRPGDYPAPFYGPAFGRMAELGILYTALAGLLNLLAMIDLVYGDPRRGEGEKSSGGDAALCDSPLNKEAGV
ncbi:MAG: hypothetical protein IT443_02075, partial [Phycisphaeraceae bacterium]|nr:hypothetical protein [Phycisphaeraceae bacterium]